MGCSSQKGRVSTARIVTISQSSDAVFRPKTLRRSRTNLNRSDSFLTKEGVIDLDNVSSPQSRSHGTLPRVLSLRLERTRIPNIDSIFHDSEFTLFMLETSYNLVIRKSEEFQELTYTADRGFYCSIVAMITYLFVELKGSLTSLQLEFMNTFPFIKFKHQNLSVYKNMYVKWNELNNLVKRIENFSSDFHSLIYGGQMKLSENWYYFNRNSSKIIDSNIKVIESTPNVLNQLKMKVRSVIEGYLKACSYLKSTVKFYELKRIGESTSRDMLRDAKRISEIHWARIF